MANYFTISDFIEDLRGTEQRDGGRQTELGKSGIGARVDSVLTGTYCPAWAALYLLWRYNGGGLHVRKGNRFLNGDRRVATVYLPLCGRRTLVHAQSLKVHL